MLNCPFCGGAPSATGRITYSGKPAAWFPDGSPVREAFFVNCMICSCDNKGLIGHQTPDAAIAAWNRRAPPEQSAAGHPVAVDGGKPARERAEGEAEPQQ